MPDENVMLRETGEDLYIIAQLLHLHVPKQARSLLGDQPTFRFEFIRIFTPDVRVSERQI